MRLQLATWKDVENYLKKCRGIIIPIGSTEQHGPTGLIGTDAICPEKIAFGVGDVITAMVAPTLSLGIAQHHLGFPGSMTLRPSTLIAVIEDVVMSLRRHGFTHFYFLNGHGGNISTVRAAIAEIYTKISLEPQPPAQGIRIKLANWFTYPKVMVKAKALYGDAEGSHATPSEVSLSYYAYPEAVRQAPLKPQVAPSGPFHDAYDYRTRFPDGRIGSDPSLASIDDGEVFYEIGVASAIQDFEAFLKEPC